jgi:hypothetical protein
MTPPQIRMSYLTVFNNEILFNGCDAAGDRDRGLWVTDGTAAGTPLTRPGFG